jgi:DNA-binding response OmpR family regulator
VVLDIRLPGMDGFDVARNLRTRSEVPILMLTARDEEPDRVAGLELGADDYLTKPFSPRELVARMKAVLRRTDGRGAEDVLTLGDVELKRDQREVEVDGETVELTTKEFDLLAALLENPGIVISRDQLLDRVWGMTYPGGTRTVDVHVAQLRRKLGRPELIRTVRGAGYKAVRQ